MGNVLTNQNQHIFAEVRYQRALGIYLELHGKGHRDVMDVCKQIAKGMELQKANTWSRVWEWMKGKDVKVIRKAFKKTEMVYLGKGLHFFQEDHPHEIGDAISKWYTKSVLS